jgi:ferritin
MVSPAVEKAINEQVRTELQSSYTYLAMAAHFEKANLPGFAGWMRLQSEEERGHALKLFDFLLDRGGTPELGTLDRPRLKGGAALEVLEQALEHERRTSALIHKLYETAGKERDYATQTQLQWFLTEQVEEEKTVGLVVEQVRMAGSQPSVLLMLDRQMAARATKA